MLANRDEVKGYIGQDVILVAIGSMNQLTIVVGNLYDYGFFDSIPFGTANMLGAAKLVTVQTGAGKGWERMELRAW